MMKRIVVILLCLFTCINLVSCGGNSSTDDTQSTSQTLTSIKLYDTMNEKFVDKELIQLNIPDGFTATKENQLMHKNPIYYVGEFKNEQNTIAIFEYTDPNFNIETYQKLNDNWVISTTEDTTESDSENYSKTAYTIKDKNIIGITVMNNDKSELTVDNFVSKLSYLIQEDLNIPEPSKEESITVEGTLSNPAKLGETVSTFLYNNVSKKYEPVLITINQVFTDTNYDEINKYNNIGNRDTSKNSEFINYSIPSTNSSIDCIIYSYSIFFPSTFTTENGVITDPTIPVTVVSMSDETSINGVLNLYKTVKDFNDVYKNTAKPGEDYTNGLGVFQMSKNFKNYLIKIDTGNNNVKYYTVK